MKIIDEQTIKDLEFDDLRQMLQSYCSSESAKKRMIGLVPLPSFNELNLELQKLKEHHQIKTEGYTFPRIDFEELNAEIKLLGIKGSILSEIGFQNILLASTLVNEIVQFFKKEKSAFPHLFDLTEQVCFTKELINPIEKVFTQKGQVKDDASTALAIIRKDIILTRRNISRLFNKELKRFIDRGFLGDTKEAYIQDRRVLAVQSTFKRQVEGSVQGHSKTGNLTYIEPQAVVSFNHELEMLFDDERREIRKILSELTNAIRDSLPLLKAYQWVLTHLDFIQAKTRLAIELNCSMPAFAKETQLELIDAFHPLLWLKNKKENKTTQPQSLKLNHNSRMLVISGPNAGGKSITLKTVGLLQLMFQSGLMIPAHANSKMCFFQHILTDIGDNQSIENQLSTYSYRLKRMKHFLTTTNKKSLLLLDEFGTGSDPDLGGALAEVFFEQLYERKSYGIITTHYSNIKLKAASLNHAINGSMLFDKESLEPLYKLDIGQPGSSFTFEVAKINGIPDELLKAAESRLDDNKVKMDQLIAELQMEKAQIQKLSDRHLRAELEAQKSEHKYKMQLSKLSDKEKAQAKLIEENNNALNKGKKLISFVKRYDIKGKNKDLLDEIKKYVAVERTKELDLVKANKMKQDALRKKNKTAKVRPNQHLIKIGSTVRLIQGKENGQVLEMDKGFATVAFGIFKTKVKLNQLKFIN